MVVLSSLMLLTAGYSLVSGLLKLRDPSVVLTVATTESAGSQAEMQRNQALMAARNAVVEPRRGAVRAEAVAESLLALFALYATAAVLSRDPAGRRLAMAVGFLGMVYQLATLPLYMMLMRDYAGRSAGLLAEAVMERAGEPQALTHAEVTTRLQAALIGGPVFVAIVGVVGSAVLFGFFAGPRGRALYGLPARAARGRRPGPGGDVV
jgi:hypothetical protein